MFRDNDIRRNACQLYGKQATQGYDWWWHSFTAINDATGEERPFYIEYFLCNPDRGTDYPILGQLEENKEKGLKPSYLMVNVGTWGKDHRQLHRFFSWKETKVDFGVPYKVEAADCFATETLLKGSVNITEEEAKNHPEWLCDSGSMQWNLTVAKEIPFNVGYGAGGLMRKLQLFEMFWHAEGMKTAYSGTIVLNGENYTVSPETCYGYADKNWGKDFTTPWLWLSSNDLVSEITGKRLENSVFDIGGGRPKIGPVSLKGKLLSAFWYEGSGFEFNFSKFWTFTRTKFSCKETDDEIIWHVEQKTWRNRMVTDITCKKEDMLLIQYEAPNGTKRHTRLWNGGNGKGTVELYRGGKLVDRIRAEHIGCEYGEYDADSPYMG
ncbi:MAG: hypothetical protein HUJ75_08670 [Parasporobacterium sp.]|nr:hypothetical protein [Parasporobacterium sp.]